MYIDSQRLSVLSTRDIYDLIEERKKGLENQNITQKVRLLSNITINQFEPWLKLFFINEGIRPDITIGDFDNILNESYNVRDGDIVFIFLEMSDYQDHVLMRKSEQDLNRLRVVENLQSELTLILNNCKEAKHVFLNSLSLARINAATRFPQLKEIESKLAEVIEGFDDRRIQIVDIDNVYQNIGLGNAINSKFYQISKAPFTNLFYAWYLNQIKPDLLTTIGKKKKVIIVDCDNTLWKGIVGEDGINGIELSKPFIDVQITLKRLTQQGVLLVACSKNNLEDVIEVFHSRDDMVLTPEDFVSLKVNWNPKSTNIKRLGAELNLGLDSFLFIDDSEFEINEVKQALPMVETFHVPKQSHGYFKELSFCLRQFVSSEVLAEDMARSQLYKAESKRISESNSFEDYETYLESLELKVLYSLDDENQIKRIAQLTQKTNQFNLTTKRYSEADVESMMRSDSFSVLSFAVKDRFGDYGIVGVTILRYVQDQGQIDTFLMSCRVLGRGIEKAIIDIVLTEFVKNGVKGISSEYRKTAKNQQVSELYDLFGFKPINSTGERKEYQLKFASGKDKIVNKPKYVSISRL